MTTPDGGVGVEGVRMRIQLAHEAEHVPSKMHTRSVYRKREDVVPQTGYDRCRLTATTDLQSSPRTLTGAGTGSKEPGRLGEPQGSGACAFSCGSASQAVCFAIGLQPDLSGAEHVWLGVPRRVAWRADPSRCPAGAQVLLTVLF